MLANMLYHMRFDCNVEQAPSLNHTKVMIQKLVVCASIQQSFLCMLASIACEKTAMLFNNLLEHKH